MQMNARHNLQLMDRRASNGLSSPKPPDKPMPKPLDVMSPVQLLSNDFQRGGRTKTKRIRSGDCGRGLTLRDRGARAVKEPPILVAEPTPRCRAYALQAIGAVSPAEQ
jgi:hypothetical protein